VFPEHIHTHPYRRGLTGKSKGRRDMQGPKRKKESARAIQRERERERERGGEGFKFKPLNPHGRGMDTFWNNTIKTLTLISENGLG